MSNKKPSFDWMNDLQSCISNKMPNNSIHENRIFQYTGHQVSNTSWFCCENEEYWTEITTSFLFSSSKRVIQCKEARDYKWRFYKFQFVEISFQISLEHGSILPSELGHRTSFVISWGLRSQSELFAPGKERPVKRSAVVSRCRPLKWHSTHACLVLGHFSGKFWIVSIVVDFYLFFFAEKECEEVTFFQHYVVWVRWGVA